MPYLWIPYEKEISSSSLYATEKYESHMKQYHSFANISNFAVKADMKDTNTSYYWWTASAYHGSSQHFCVVETGGSVGTMRAVQWYVGAPLCFRFQ